MGEQWLAAIKNFQTSFFKHSSMLVSIMLVILLAFNCGGEIVKVGEAILDLPTYTTACQSHDECKDSTQPTGEYCTLSKKCSRKKDGNSWCFEDAECASEKCFVSSCTFLEAGIDNTNSGRLDTKILFSLVDFACVQTLAV